MSIEAATPDTPCSPASAGAARADVEAIVELVRQSAAVVAREGAAGWSPTVRREVLAQVGVAISGLGIVRGAVLVAEKTSQEWKGTGAGSLDIWAAGRSGQEKRATGREVREAEQLDAVPDVAEQVVAGAISPERVRIILLASDPTERRRAERRRAERHDPDGCQEGRGRPVRGLPAAPAPPRSATTPLSLSRGAGWSNPSNGAAGR